MLTSKFHDEVNSVFSNLTEVRKVKFEEYGSNGKPFDSFVRGRALTNESPTEYWLGIWSKGTIALYQAIFAGVNTNNEEMVLDCINYLLLLTALIENPNCTTEEAEKIIKNTEKHCIDVLKEKAKQYAVDEDRLAMFKSTANILGITPEKALANFMQKHTFSIIDGINKKIDDKKFWLEKVTDHINYLLLLFALLAESKEDQKDGSKKTTTKDTKIPDVVEMPFEVTEEEVL